MIKFDVITIFPKIFDSYIGESLIARAQKKKLIKINVHNLRKWAKGPHKQVDDRPFGGGLGMVMQVEPVYKAILALRKFEFRNPKSETNLKIKNRKFKTKTILFTPRGEKFTQKIAYKLSKMDQIIFICGRYEGIDERVAKNLADIELSMGDYDLMGGELPAMTTIEAISRLVPGVLGKPQLLKERITKSGGFIECAQYTRPEVFKTKDKKIWRVPKVLTTGDHKKIEAWKKQHSKIIE
jgi:tRNA (guanine37-N1)-methyltransferase